MSARRMVQVASVAIGFAIAIGLASRAWAHNYGEMGDMDMDMQRDAKASHMSPGDVDAMSHGAMMGQGGQTMRSGNMMLHMVLSPERPANASDQARAAKLVVDLKHALSRYKDYKAAEAAGYKPFHPEFKHQKLVYFTRRWYAIKAFFGFNPSEPTSLLYEPEAGGGYKLVGAMYTAPREDSPEALNKRVPLSVARWHRHINLCFAPKHTPIRSVDWNKFGPNGSIATKEACEKAGGSFYRHLFGWMVQVFPWEKNPGLIWAH